MPRDQKTRFFKGINKNKEAYLIDEGQMSDMKNMKSDDGLLVKRSGYDIEVSVATDTDASLYFPSAIFSVHLPSNKFPDEGLLFSSFKPLEDSAYNPTTPSTPNETIITKYNFAIELEANEDLVLLESGDKILLE